MTESIAAKRVWTANGWLENARVHIRGSVITKIDRDIPADECSAAFLIPGMIELHTHGSLGYDVSAPDSEKNADWLRRLAQHGVTGVLPTTASHAPADLQRAISFYNGIMCRPIESGAKILGVHMEGPFLNKAKKGGMIEEHILAPSVESFRQIVGAYESTVKQITLAPEEDGAIALIRYLKEHGIRVNAGHSNATAEEMRRAIDAGLDGVTHFFNAAHPILHRDPGFLTEALLNDGVFCEAVCDLVHIAPEMIRLLIKCAGAKRMIAVTDSVFETGLPDGVYGDRIVTDGSPRLFDGTLTGGRYLTDDCARALIGIGIDPWNVFCMTSHTPALRLGLTNAGDIAPGYTADLVEMDESYRVLRTVIDGK